MPFILIVEFPVALPTVTDDADPDPIVALPVEVNDPVFVIPFVVVVPVTSNVPPTVEFPFTAEFPVTVVSPVIVVPELLTTNEFVPDVSVTDPVPELPMDVLALPVVLILVAVVEVRFVVSEVKVNAVALPIDVPDEFTRILFI